MSGAPGRRAGRPAVGRTTPLERDEILERALQIVDREGRDELSMRRLAKELGVTPMALYHYVRDKKSLMSALVDKVWAEIYAGMPAFEGDSAEWMIQSNIRVREVWLQHADLANLAVAVSEPDEVFFQLTSALTEAVERTGFPDVALAYSAVQNFTMGSIQTNANRRAASLYFGRDPDVVRDQVEQLLVERRASPNHRAVVEARFDDGDDANFEPSLRTLVDGLLAG